MLLYCCFLFQLAWQWYIEKAAVERYIPEPRLAIFGSDDYGYTNMEGFILTEPEALTALIAHYYVFELFQATTSFWCTCTPVYPGATDGNAWTES